MSARKRKMIAKANALIDFGYKPTFRQLNESYKFWRGYMKVKGLDHRTMKILRNHSKKK